MQACLYGCGQVKPSWLGGFVILKNGWQQVVLLDNTLRQLSFQNLDSEIFQICAYREQALLELSKSRSIFFEYILLFQCSAHLNL